jgi:hypothetical protein
LRPCPGPPSAKRIPPRQPKDGSAHPSNGGSATFQEESFQLLPCPVTAGRPFAMIIRLQPEMLEELKQADSEGHESMIKFGAYATGHVSLQYSSFSCPFFTNMVNINEIMCKFLDSLFVNKLDLSKIPSSDGQLLLSRSFPVNAVGVTLQFINIWSMNSMHSGN